MFFTACLILIGLSTICWLLLDMVFAQSTNRGGLMYMAGLCIAIIFRDQYLPDGWYISVVNFLAYSGITLGPALYLREKYPDTVGSYFAKILWDFRRD